MSNDDIALHHQLSMKLYVEVANLGGLVYPSGLMLGLPNRLVFIPEHPINLVHLLPRSEQENVRNHAEIREAYQIIASSNVICHIQSFEDLAAFILRFN